MAGNDRARGIDKYWVGESVELDTIGDLTDLPL